MDESSRWAPPDIHIRDMPEQPRVLMQGIIKAMPALQEMQQQEHLTDQQLFDAVDELMHMGFMRFAVDQTTKAIWIEIHPAMEASFRTL